MQCGHANTTPASFTTIVKMELALLLLVTHSRTLCPNKNIGKNTVQFTRADGSHEEIIIKTNAAKQTITVFPSVASGIDTLPTKFTVADYVAIGTFQEIMTDQKHGVLSIIDKLYLSNTNPEVVHSWTEFWNTFPEGNKCPAELLDLFSLPKVQTHESLSSAKQTQASGRAY